MNLKDAFEFVFKTMFEKKSRVFLTVSGIIIGIFTFTFFIFVSQGLQNAIYEQFSSFGVSVLGIQSAENTNNGPPGGGGLTDTDLEKIKQVVRDYKYIAPGIFYSAQYEYGREKEVMVSLSYPDEYWEDVKQDLNVEIEEGRDLKSGDSGVIVMGAKVARDTFSKEISVGSSLKVGDKNFRVIGIMKEKGDLFLDSSILMPFDDIKEISGQNTYTIIRVSFYDNVDLEVMKEAVDRKLNQRGKDKRVNISSPSQAIEQFNQILGVLTMIISFVSSIALLVGGINVMNTMYSNVIERTNEISVMKAMGSKNSDILTLYLLESSILGMLGSLIGFFMAYFLAEGLSYVIINFAGYNVPIYFDVNFFIFIVLITTFLAMLFGTYPAFKGAKINPADNLRDE